MEGVEFLGGSEGVGGQEEERWVEGVALWEGGGYQ